MFPISSYQVFTYGVPASLLDAAQVGMRVNAPIGKRHVKGIIVGLKKAPGFEGKIRNISSLIDDYPVLDDQLWKLVNWIGEYYHTPIGQVAKAVLPNNFSSKYEPQKKYYVELLHSSAEEIKNAPAQNRVIEFLKHKEGKLPMSSLSSLVSNPLNICRSLKEKGLVEFYAEEDLPELDDISIITKNKKIVFTNEQRAINKKLEQALGKKEYSPFLIHGVTGSGKTEIYIEIIKKTISAGKTAILLLPEISLTPQISGRFKSVFGSRVALWHSKMTNAARAWTWREVCAGNFSIVIGARSAIFAPLKNIGVIIVDEEQEGSYKQDAPAPRYHARDVALMRGKLHGAITILASATPSLESYYNAGTKKLELLRLTQRFGRAKYPEVSLVDMSKEEAESGKTGQIFSGLLLDKISERLIKNEQVILLQNRRGYSPVLRCRDCGKVVECPHCQVSLAYHKVGSRLQCHFCGYYLRQVPMECGECFGHDLQMSGAGTQKIEEQLGSAFPKARIIRIDQDTAGTGKKITSLLAAFSEGKADILLGTQMIAKGLDFGKVTLVGIINGDTGMYLPDFRAGERTYQLIYQASGRAGRHERPGEVVIQTYQPENNVIKSAALLNVEEFYQHTLEERKELGYPPFSWMVKIEISGKNKLDVYDRANAIKSALGGNRKGLEIKGPVPCYWEKLSDRYRQMIVVSSLKDIDPSGSKLNTFIKKKIIAKGAPLMKKNVSISIDVNPISLL